jgi:cytochrome c peroxidase
MCRIALRKILRDDDGVGRPNNDFSLRGVKDTPPYLHKCRLLTLEDTVEYFNLVLDRKLTDQEKTELLAFLRACEIGDSR